jgi:hypothetical protein
MAGGWHLKLTFNFVAKTYEPLHLEERSSVQSKILDIPASFIKSLFSLTELFNIAVFRNYDVMMGQTLNYFV